jgi:hypothetical protein
VKGNADDKGAKALAVLPPPLPPSLPQTALEPTLSGLQGRQAWSSQGSASFQAHRQTLNPVRGDAVAQWLRPVRNLRRAIVVATILGPPSH